MPYHQQLITEDLFGSSVSIYIVTETKEKFAENYLKKRAIQSDAVICSVVGIHSDEDAIIIRVDDQMYKVTISLTDGIESQELVDYVKTKFIDNEDTDKGVTVDISDQATYCKFGSSSVSHRIEPVGSDDTSIVKDGDRASNFVREMILNYAYNDEGMKATIRSVNGTSEDSFTVVATVMGIDIVWDLSIPKSTNKDASETARLIEEVGGGNPEMLEGGEIYIVRDTDPTFGLSYVTRDRNSRWQLVVPSTYHDWEDTTRLDKLNRSKLPIIGIVCGIASGVLSATLIIFQLVSTFLGLNIQGSVFGFLVLSILTLMVIAIISLWKSAKQ